MNVLTVLLQQQGSGMSMIFMMIAIFAIMYFFMIRPQNKKQKEIQNFRNSITPGQDIVTAGGIYGKVVGIENETVNVEVAKGTVMKISRFAIQSLEKEKNT